jgi:hypothetical protein
MLTDLREPRSEDESFANLSCCALLVHHLKTQYQREYGHTPEYGALDVDERLTDYLERHTMKLGLPPVGSLELLFFRNYERVGSELRPVYRWVDDAYAEEFDLFFSLPIMVEERCASLKRTIQWHSAHTIEVLLEAKDALESVVRLFENERFKDKRFASTFINHVQPFMTWGTNFRDDDETYVGASGPMSPSLNILHELLHIESSSTMYDILVDSRRYMKREDRRLIAAAKLVGDRMAREASEDEATEMVRNQCISLLHRFRQLHMRLAARSISVNAGKGYESTGMTTTTGSLRQSVKDFQSINHETLAATTRHFALRQVA